MSLAPLYAGLARGVPRSPALGLTVAEQRLVETGHVDEARGTLKRVRTLLIEAARLQIDSMIQVITGVKVRNQHHDISTVTGEELLVFTLDEAPSCREVKQR